MSNNGMSLLRPRTLTLHYNDISLYKSLLLRLPGPLRALTACAPRDTESDYARDLVVSLSSLTPKIAELTSATVDCSCEVRLARTTDPNAFDAGTPFISNLCNSLSKLQTMAESISCHFENCVAETSSVAKTVDDYCHEKETSTADLKRRWIRLQNSMHKTRKRMKQTDNAIEELNGIHRLAVYQCIRTRSQLGLVMLAHCVGRLFGAADKRVLAKVKSKSLMAAKVEKRIRHDSERLIRRRKCEMEDLALLATNENMGRHALACYNADMRNLGRTARHLRNVSCTLEVAGIAWLSVAKTFQAITFSCTKERTVEEVLELWQTVSVLTRSFLESHLDSIAVLLGVIEGKQSTFDRHIVMEGSRRERRRWDHTFSLSVGSSGYQR